MKMPEPEIKEAKFGGYDAYTHAQMKQYGRDLLEAAAQLAEGPMHFSNPIAADLRSMKEKL